LNYRAALFVLAIAVALAATAVLATRPCTSGAK
jgi:hypothetical protein